MAIDKTMIPTSSALSSLSRFRKIVLGWDYIRLLTEAREREKKGAKGDDGLKRIKHTYKDFDEYIGFFEPLIFEEVKAQITQQNKDEQGLDWQKGVIQNCVESDGFYKVDLWVALNDFRDQISENDLLILSKEKFEEGKDLPVYGFALVQHRCADGSISLLTFLDGEVKELDYSEAKSSSRLLKMLAVFKVNNSIVWVKKMCSLSTIMREYVALHSVAYLPIRELILTASEKLNAWSSEDREWNVPRPLMDYLKDNLNDSQIEAIHAGLSRRTFVLIQGPPGTGKTQTILGLLSAVLHSSPARVQSKRLSALKHRTEIPMQDKYCNWIKASPWLTEENPRDLIVPTEDDDAFFSVENELKPEIINSNRKYRVHVLVCAPSNSALDEIILRILRTGIHDEMDHVYHPKIVRIGLKPHPSVKAVSMDYLVEQRLSGVDRSSSGAAKQGAGGAKDREDIRASILSEAAIVFSTLSFSGSAVFARMNRVFDVVIIDEAAQAVEPATLIPLAHGCKQVYLVGDPVQLPATVISPTAQRLGYGTSLFKRFQEAGFPVQMLKTQYRMHPEISIFPSKEFYDGTLEDGELVKRQTKRSWHDYRCFGPFSFFDIDGAEFKPPSGSYINEDEADFIVLMYHKLAAAYPELKSSSQLAVITPYREQMKLIQERFHTTFGEFFNQVDINTVDGFQGMEKDVAIFSCVRANTGKGIGFVSDFRRMNVGITRARSSILVVGSASTLMQDDHWSNLINSAKDRGCYFKVPKPYASFFSDSNLLSLRVKSAVALEKKLKEMEDELGRMEREPINIDDGHQEQGDMDVDDGGGYDED